MLIYLVTLVVVLLLAYVVFGKKNFPPGPYGLPIVGYSPFLGKNPVLTLANLKKKYGNVVQVPLGMKNVVFINDFETMKEAFVKQADIFNGRPRLFIPQTIFENNDIIFTDGPTWKQLRRFSLQTLRDFGVGRTSLEAIVMEEVEKLTQHLSAKNGTPVQTHNLFFVPIMNIIWGICAGKIFDLNDENINSFKKGFHELSRLGIVNLINFLPILRHIIPGGLGFHEMNETMQKIKRFLEKELDNHREKFEETNKGDFIDFYLSKIYSHNKDGQELPPFNKIGLIGTVMDLFIAGTDTTSTTLAWGFLYLASRPEIQKKIQEELDKHICKDSYLSPSSKTLLPYTEATILEIQRYSTIVPLGVPHRTFRATTLMGYDIPENTTVFSNLYAIHNDKEYWGDPEVFRPERFLDEFGKVKKDEHLVPFSLGPRLCLGESLARSELFLFFTTMLRRFTFELNPNEPKPTEEPFVGGINKPYPFSCIIKYR